jgi:hypothetical protein
LRRRVLHEPHRSPAAALVADCFIRPQRTKANAALNVVGALAGVIFSIVGRKLIVQPGRRDHLHENDLFRDCRHAVPSIVYFLAVRENKVCFADGAAESELGLIDEKTDTSDKNAYETDEE